MENNTQPTEHKKSGSGMMITIVIIVLIAIIALASSGNSKKDQAIKDAAMMEQQATLDEAMMQKDGDTSITGEKQIDETAFADETMRANKGSYEDYAPDKLSLANKGHVVLFFKADWCPSCKAVDKDINANLGSIPDGTHILKIDYDNSKDLKKKYGVTYQHTFVQVDAQGNMIKKWSGSPTLSALVSQIKL